ncbi:MAG: insulinase family protein [Chitinophagales bacterium]|nr:insulinase family protein [Bacteroidota bacterium]MCB9257493.1 insulinase family protein [Chitinophagales bacterium]
MKNYEAFKLANGLEVLIEEDPSTPLVTLNILYKVGSKNESENKTGFAHLFEHFMFEGSKNILHFDSELQKAGGDNNAFTTNDLTNYYESLPAINLETALWLESDRMLELDFNEQSLKTQISVVIEEFKQNYLNKPYGDVWHLLMKLCYQEHPYKWPTIGKDLAHIEAITLQETKDFFYKYYRPNNAIMTIVGGIECQEALRLVKKWFDEIPAGPELEKTNFKEPKQRAARFLEVEREVPSSVIYKAYPCCARIDPDYYATDIISEILGTGEASRLHQLLVDKLDLCTEIDCYISGTDDNNLLIIEGKPNEGISLEKIDQAIEDLLEQFSKNLVGERELQKTINKAKNYIAFSNESHTNRAFNLAYFKSIDSLQLYNNEHEEYAKVSAEQIQKIAAEIFRKENCNTLFYKSNNEI